MKEIIDKLNDLEITQKSRDFLEDLPEDIYDKYFQEQVDSNLAVDKHRWYETSMRVFKIKEGFIGVVSVTDLFSEQMSINDIYHTLQFYEVEKELITSYKIIR